VVGLSVCLLVNFMSTAKPAEPTEMPFGISVGSVKSHYWKGQFLGVVRPI